MNIKTKLVIVLVVSIVSMIVVGTIGMFIASSNVKALDNIEKVRLAKIVKITDFSRTVVDLKRYAFRISTLNLLPYNQQLSGLKTTTEQYRTLIEKAQTYMPDYEKLGSFDGSVRTDWDAIKSDFNKWIELDKSFLREIDSALVNPSEAALRSLFERIGLENMDNIAATNKLADELQKFVTINERIASETVFAAESQTNAMLAVLAVATIAIIFLVFFMIYSLYSSIVKPIGRARDVVVQVAAEQNLKLRVAHKSKDEIGEMVAAFDRMMEKIQQSVLAIKKSVKEVDDEVESLNKAAETVAEGSQAQSSATSSMAASVEEMSVSISSVSSNASDAQKLAGEAGEVSVQGSQVIEKTADKMSAMVEVVTRTSQVIQALGEESRQISSVVQVIKDVADQTNLLALNAAIEAARAGDQGRGFAVVADEVRKLAERTAKSIDDITAMINKIQASANEAVEEMDKVVRQVEQGQKLTQEAGEKMRTIKDQSVKVSEAIDEISNALKEQSLAGQDIAKNVENIAQMTDKNSEAAAGASNGAKRLGRLAGDVNSTLAQFEA
ncbi:MAG: methyl-accepting chemotaxis protein [Helicobacteraceae bacterium]|nr:methyl-accepting chemotaxis protein [Helicobacteraceae bacterium]